MTRRHRTGWITDQAGHWLWQGPRYHNKAYASVGGTPMAAHRILWTETYGPGLPPKGAHLANLCHVAYCVRPDHQRLRNARMLWKSLRRDKKEIDLAKLYLRMHSPPGLCWLRDRWSLTSVDLAYAAGHLQLDLLAIVAAWSELAEEALLPVPDPPRFDLEKTAAVLAEDIAAKENLKVHT